MFTYAMNNPVNMEDPNGYWPKWVEAIGTIACGVATVAGAFAAGMAAATGGALFIAGAMAVVGIGTCVVGLAKTVAVATGAKDEVVDRINIKENVATTFLGEKTGKKISAGIDVGMVLAAPAKGIQNAIRDPKGVINAGKAILKSTKNIKPVLKNPMTYVNSWDKYSSGSSLLQGLHNLNMISDETYNKLIPIFDPK